MQSIIRLFPIHMRDNLAKCGVFDHDLEEIRVRVNEYLMFLTAGDEMFLRGAELVEKADGACCRIGRADVDQMCTFMSKYSLYAYEEEMRQGFLTVEGGHRIGICGQVSAKNGHVRRIYPISYLNIRIASEHRGCSSVFFPFLHRENEFMNTLIMSAPGIGKTTLLRDLVRLVSGGTEAFRGKKVGLIDERSEIAGSIYGIPQNDVGPRTDVLDGCPKEEGMMLMVRSMSPEILAVDEIGGRDDLRALQYAMRCGCRALATVHCRDMEELQDKPGWAQCLKQKFFARYVKLGCEGGKRIGQVFDEMGRLLCSAEYR